MKFAVAAVTAKKARKPAPRGEAASRVKLTAAQVVAIRALGGEIAQAKIASEYGISQSNVSAILLRKTWRHLP